DHAARVPALVRQEQLPAVDGKPLVDRAAALPGAAAVQPAVEAEPAARQRLADKVRRQPQQRDIDDGGYGLQPARPLSMPRVYAPDVNHISTQHERPLMFAGRGYGILTGTAAGRPEGGKEHVSYP